LSPLAELVLQSRSLELPDAELNGWEQIWYTLVTSLRDYPMLRFGVLFLLGYLVIRSLSRLIGVFVLPLLAGFTIGTHGPSDRGGHSGALASRAVGALFGAAHGAGRALVFMAALFIYV